MIKTYSFNCRDLSANRLKRLESGGLSAEIFHRKGDPERVHRIRLSTAHAEVELLPSKGLSVGEAFFRGNPLFWEPPIGMPDPETLDLWSEEVSIDGKAAPGFTFLKTFNGGIELYGLNNWGMPVEKEGELLLLHGETSNIPVESVAVHMEPGGRITVSGSFLYRTWKGDHSIPWYERGDHLCRVLRFVHLFNGGEPRLEVEDVFENAGSRDFLPDWGYHITFRPEEDAKISVPARKAEERSGGPLPEDYSTWHGAEDPEVRSETGIIFKGLEQRISNGRKMNRVHVRRPTLGDLMVEFTPAPYMQTWMCNGGAGSREFTRTGSGEPLFRKNWDGMGIEIGASALDHNGNTDPEVPVPAPLPPGGKTTVRISVEPAT